MIITTKKVRAIMNNHFAGQLYTNKTKNDTSDNRRVKCYLRDNENLLRELRMVAGRENVTVTKGSGRWNSYGPGIVVKCLLS